MRSPIDFIVGGFLIAFLSVVPLGAGFVLGNEWSPVGFIGAVVMWSVGGLLAQIGVIGAGVHIGLRARADERARQESPAAKPRARRWSGVR